MIPHDTPMRGDWLNVAKPELSALARQCRDRRISDIMKLRARVGKVAWRFAADATRDKLECLDRSVERRQRSSDQYQVIYRTAA